MPPTICDSLKYAWTRKASLPAYALMLVLVRVTIYSLYRLRNGVQQSDREVQVRQAIFNIRKNDYCPNISAHASQYCDSDRSIPRRSKTQPRPPHDDVPDQNFYTKKWPSGGVACSHDMSEDRIDRVRLQYRQ